jgi:DNA-binding CsgD family transcriptional regulator
MTSAADLARRRRRVAKLRSSGKTVREIARTLGCGTTAVTKDLKAIAGNRATVTPSVYIQQRTERIAKRRQEVVQMRRRGMTYNQIARALGVEKSTVHNDVTAVIGQGLLPPRPRPPLPDAATTAAWTLRRVVERIEKIMADDRFPACKDQVSPDLRAHLKYAATVCPDLLGRIDQQRSTSP